MPAADHQVKQNVDFLRFTVSRKNGFGEYIIFGFMKGTTLGQVRPGSSFWFGGIRFLKYKNSDEEMVPCYIYGTELMVHITNCAWVLRPKISLVLKDHIFYLEDLPAVCKRLLLLTKK